MSDAYDDFIQDILEQDRISKLAAAKTAADATKPKLTMVAATELLQEKTAQVQREEPVKMATTPTNEPFTGYKGLDELRKWAAVEEAKEEAMKKEARFNFLAKIAPPLTRHNVAQARDARNLASQYLTKKNIPHKVNIGTSATIKDIPKELNPKPGQQMSIGQGNAGVIPWSGKSPEQPYRVFLASPKPEIALHETGHVANMSDLTKLIGYKGRVGAYAARGVASRGSNIGGIATSAVTDPEGALGQNAWMIPALGALPLLGEEALASARGLNYLRQARGRGTALRAVPRMFGALGTYFAPPTHKFLRNPALSALIAATINRVKMKLSQPKPEP